MIVHNFTQDEIGDVDRRTEAFYADGGLAAMIFGPGEPPAKDDILLMPDNVPYRVRTIRPYGNVWCAMGSFYPRTEDQKALDKANLDEGKTDWPAFLPQQNP